MANGTQPPSYLPAGEAAPAAPAPRAGGRVLRVLGTILLVLSLGANAVLLLLVLVLGAMAGASMGGALDEDTFIERTIEKGPGDHKIAVVRISGLIEDNLAEQVRRQLDKAAHDGAVKAVILRINSPGGYLTASDELYHYIDSFSEKTGKPVVAAMDGVAASGGYYAACAADTIVAQRTTVTGSIGIIAQFFFLQGLMEDKLGIQTVTLKRGQQKDWPNMFTANMTPEQRDYIMTAMLEPGYDQFVDIVASARKMDREDVLRLATGRIYLGPEARENGLVDEIGFFGRAVEIAKAKAGLASARVVEYAQPFGLANLLGLSTKTEKLLDLGPDTLADLASPRIMVLWTGR